MTASDRSSGRVVEPGTNNLARGPESANSGADDSNQLATHHTHRPAVGRTGSQKLSLLKSSLSNRQLSILQALDQLKFSAARQIERLLYPLGENGFTPLSAARTSRRDLAELHRLQLVDRLDRRVGGLRAGSASFIYSLSPLGARVLGHSTRRRSREPSLAHLDHVLEVAELVVRLYEEARSGAVELVGIETEPDCWRPVVGPNGSRLTLKPDLRVTLAVGEHELHWFVEIDRGSEHRPVLMRKCSVYLGAWRDGREQAVHGVFPRVLWVLPDAARVDVIISVIDALPGAPTGMFVTTTEDQAMPILMGEGGRS
jgi:hypothetical protein